MQISCVRAYGHADFDLARLTAGYPNICPIRDCDANTVEMTAGRRRFRACTKHGIQLRSNTFIYWNGPGFEEIARLRNFATAPELARAIALGSNDKAEKHRLGYEMSEDALTWNVFVGLAEARLLRDAIRFLTGVAVDEEPQLYLWGTSIPVMAGTPKRFAPLDAVRRHLESDIGRFKTEPDVMLVMPDGMIVCVEAKFGSGNPLAHDGAVASGEKPVDRAGLLERYLDRSCARTIGAIIPSAIGPRFHSQLFRNIVFASEMAARDQWHVVNLVSNTQWATGNGSASYSYDDPTDDVRAWLARDAQERFHWRTWEALFAEVIGRHARLAPVQAYMRSKSAHFRAAFQLEG